jgi:hypothetical protein
MIDLPTAIKACDLHLGVPSVLMDNGLLRKELYGKAGAYRKKSYGGEYRTLSNYWIFDEQKIGWVYQAVENALEAVLNGYNPDEDGELIQTCINTNDIAMASGLIAKHSLYMV